MEIAIANGNPDAGNTTFDHYLEELSDRLRSSRHTVDLLNLRDLNIRHCIGCFDCWKKTPGVCVHTDDMPIVLRAFLRSNLFVMASPVTMGFTSSLLKQTHDRFLPVLMPYITFIKGEMHHRKRYRRYPDFGILVQEADDTDAADIAIIRRIYERDMRNLHSRLKFVYPISKAAEEVAGEIDHR